MRFSAEKYYRAGIERMNQARTALRDKDGTSFALAMYCGGLAVECILRAFRWEEDQTFEGRHDLSDLLKASRLLTIDEDYMRRKGAEDEVRKSAIALRSAMNEVVILWHNNLRFASEASLKAFLNRIDRWRGVKGDPLKKNATDLMNAAQTVVNRGITLLTSKKR